MCQLLEMWYSSGKEVSPREIEDEYLQVLERAIQNAALEEVRTPELYDALDFLKVGARGKSWGFTLFYEALENGNIQEMKHAYLLIKRSMCRE
jgi:hypothetical protein